nr:dihydrolipoyllysine-residue succinyltransferase component of 2-oxoglutarate dehydrogenase complex 1, mitochondrial-like [Ipomoea batatas]
MLGVLRRKVASGATSASALGKSLHTVRPGLFTPRACSVVAEEILIHPIGCDQARNFCHLNLPGNSMNLRAQRSVVFFFLFFFLLKIIYNSSTICTCIIVQF